MKSKATIMLRLLAAVCISGCFTMLACVNTISANVEDWWDGRGPVVPHSTFPADCALCHSAENWQTMRGDFSYDHEKETGFRLVGAHAEAQCLRCHNDRGPVEYFSNQGCAGCHSDVHQGRLQNRCLDCHNETDWHPSGQLAEHSRTRFPLFGAHAAATCDRCHPGIGSGQFDPLPTECASCHQADLAAALEPNHVNEGWIQSCDRCHRATTWAQEGFVHDFFPLSGGHNTACIGCHSNEVFDAVPTECSTCHLDVFSLPTDPDHIALNLPMNCERCHDIQAWAPAGFDHSWLTAEACADCHIDDYQATQNPSHQLWGYSKSCEECHDTNVWSNVDFDHPGIVDSCSDCHLQDFLGTQDPNHQLWGYPTTCELCHHQFSDFPPADFHHVGVVDGCVQCHLQDYLGTTDPDHSQLGLPFECELCHIPDTSWDNIRGPGRDQFLNPLRPTQIEKRPPANGKKSGGSKGGKK